MPILGGFFRFCAVRRQRTCPGHHRGRPHPCTSLQSVNSSDWASIASLATAGGTLVLAVATFASVRSANRTARAAEQSLQEGLRPLLVASRLQDDAQKVMFVDGKWLQVPGGRATAQAEGDVIYLTQAPGGEMRISALDKEVAEEIAMGEAFMDEYKNTFRALAK